MDLISHNIYLHIIQFIKPEQTHNLRLTCKKWNSIPKPNANELSFFNEYRKQVESVICMCRLAAMADNLDLPSEISHDKLLQVYEMYMHIPKSLKVKYKLHPIVIHYIKNGSDLEFHRYLKIL